MPGSVVHRPRPRGSRARRGPRRPAGRRPVPAPPAGPVTLRLQVSLTPEELATFQPAIAAVDAANPEFIVQLENVPQASEVEKVTSQLAADDLPDVLRVQGSNVQQWIRRDAFVDLTDRDRLRPGSTSPTSTTGPLDQFRWQDGLWGLPDSASPEVVFYDRAGVRRRRHRAADRHLDLRRHADGGRRADRRRRRHAIPATPASTRRPIDPLGLERRRDLLLAGRADPGPRRRAVRDRRLHDDDVHGPGEPGGVRVVGQARPRRPRRRCTTRTAARRPACPGDPFLSGKAAMGSNGSFAIGQLNAAGTIDYDIVPPLLGTDGERHTPLSTNGYVIVRRTASIRTRRGRWSRR